jgi:hypothetical protein
VPADSLPRALRNIETSSDRPRERAEAALMLGRLYYARGEYRGAADAFSRAAARLEPERKTDALYWAGMSWLAVRAPNAARSALEVVAASHSPFQPQARLAIARAWDLSSQPDRAFEVLEELLADTPAEAEPAALELYAAMADKLHRPAVAERARARLQSAYPLSMEAAAVGAEPQAATRTANAGPCRRRGRPFHQPCEGAHAREPRGARGLFRRARRGDRGRRLAQLSRRARQLPVGVRSARRGRARLAHAGCQRARRGGAVTATGTRTATAGQSSTPLMRQYARIKDEHPDAFLFFRLGDFYEMFFDDAVRGAALLGLTLTSRNKQDPDPVPMCGIPWHQRDAYVGRLLRMGHKVAICDQLEDPAVAKGIVQRGVTEVLTPGSVTGDHFLEPAANNFLAALWAADDALGVCLAEASTGEMRVLEAAWSEAADLVARLGASEWVVPLAAELPEPLADRLAALLRGVPGAMSAVPVARFEQRELLARRWGDEPMRTLAELPAAMRAAAAAVDYLDRVQGGAALQLRPPSVAADDDALRYDAATARHLELFQPAPGGEPAHTLWHHLNLAASPGGARRLRQWLERPLARPAAIAARLDAVEAWVRSASRRAAFRQALAGYPDLERLAARIACGKATPRDLGAVRDALRRLPALDAARGGGAGAPLTGVPALESRLAAALTDDPPPVSRRAASCARATTPIAMRSTISPIRASAGSPSSRRPSAHAPASARSGWATTACSATTSRSRARISIACRPTTSAARR